MRRNKTARIVGRGVRAPLGVMIVMASVTSVLAFAHLAVAQNNSNRHATIAPKSSPVPAPSPSPSVFSLAPDEKMITLLATNDIHGGIEPTVVAGAPATPGVPPAKASHFGGMATWAGIAQAIRTGIVNQYGADRVGSLTLDAGDQFQGTLISNFTEGQLTFDTMKDVGYDAIITGNHDYDFGPIGWEDDVVTPQTADQDPRGALKKLANENYFPIVSANTYLTASLSVPVKNIGCVAASDGSTLNWAAEVTASRPDFLVPYITKTVAGLTVAVIGIDNVSTPVTTMAQNVSDLCFRDEADAYLDMVAEIQASQKVDVFVMLAHDGNTDTESSISDVVRKIMTKASGAHVLDAVMAGHTHFENNVRVQGVPIIQSGSGGKMFSRIDVIYNTTQNAVDLSRTRAIDSIRILQDTCGSPSDRLPFCKSDASGVYYEGVKVVDSATIPGRISAVRNQPVFSQLASEKLGTSTAVIKVDRILESPLADVLTDAMRAASGAEIAMMNTGGMREPLPAGDIDYETFFSVIPFNNRGCLTTVLPVDKLLSLLRQSIATCGKSGALMQSGLKVVYQRNCGTSGDDDANAKLLSVSTVAGEQIYTLDKGQIAPITRLFKVATLDFLMTGGAGYSEFAGLPYEEFGIARDVLADYFMKQQYQFNPVADGRWLLQSSNPSPTSP